MSETSRLTKEVRQSLQDDFPGWDPEQTASDQEQESAVFPWCTPHAFQSSK